MRPLHLTMSGFGSFRRRCEIDFTDVDIAAFVGATGAGKSTVIDAVTFALFGQVARHGSAVAPIINRQAIEARVALKFEAAGTVYTAARTAKLQFLENLPPSSLQARTKEIRLERDDGEILASNHTDMVDAVRTLIGLDFEQFTKTAVLPQGHFARFLHDTSTKRNHALRQLLDLEIYETMRADARRRADAALAVKSECERRLESSITPEQAKALTGAAAVAQAAERSLNIHAGAAADAESQLSAAADKSAAIASDLDRLQRIEVPALTPQTDRSLRLARERLAASTLLWEQATTTADAATADADAGPDLAECLRIEKTHERAAHAREAIRPLTDAERSASEQTRSALQAQTTAEQAHGDAQRACDAAEAALVDAQAVSRDAHPKRDRASRLRALLEEHADARSQRDMLTETATAAQHRCEDANIGHRRAEGAAAAARLALQRVQSQQRAESLAAEIAPGDDCPVCGQTVRDLPHRPPAEIAAAASAATDTEEREQRAARAAADAQVEAARSEAAATAAQQRIERLDSAIAGGDAATAARLQAAADAADSAAADAQRAAQQNRRRLSAARAELDAAKGRSADARTAHSAAMAALAQTRQGLDELLAEVIGQISPQQAAAAADEARRLASALRAAQSAAADAARALQHERERLSEAQHTETAQRGVYTTARDTVAALGPPPSPGSLLEDWQALAAWSSHQTETLAETHALSDAQQHQARQRMREHIAAAETAGHGLIDTATIPRSQWPQTAAAAAAAATANAAAAEAAATHTDSTRQRADAANEEHAVADRLDRLLRSDRFQQWLMEEEAQDLASHASQRLLELSDGQFSLIFSKGDFKVRDHLNAGEERDAKSLSGGETFLASLALALSLAELQSGRATAQAPTIESLFLDEGFGTLDSATLDTAATAIESLSDTGRMVCVVTHIPELADRMPVRFKVTKDDDTSTVTRVAG